MKKFNALFSALACLHPLTSYAHGTWVDRSVVTPWGIQESHLFLPSLAAERAVPLVVALHGCHMSAIDFARLSHFEVEAEKEGFAVLFPEQPETRNSSKCWNWFLPFNQIRNSGEPALIMSALADVQTHYAIDSRRIYVTGISSGAGMANILAACYSDIFAAVASHSGIEYLQATNIFDAEPSLQSGPKTQPSESARLAFQCSGHLGQQMPALLISGTEDHRVAPENAQSLFEFYLDLNDLLDDGNANHTFPDQPPEISHRQNLGEYPYQLTDVSFHGQIQLQMIQVEGMGHAWSGGAPGLQYSDSKGPNASKLIWDFVSRFSR